MSCDQFKGQNNPNDISSIQRKLQESRDIIQGTIVAPFNDREIGISMIGEMVGTTALQKIANQGAKNISKMVLKKLVTSFNIFTDVGDILDVMDALIGDKYTMIVDQDTFQMLFNGVKQKYKDIFTQEFKTCLFNTFKTNYPQLTDQQLRMLVDQVSSMTTITTAIPNKVDVFSFQNDCFPSQTINGKKYFRTSLGPSCPMLYKQYFDQYIQQNK